MTKSTQTMMKKTRDYLEKRYQLTSKKASNCKNREDWLKAVENYRKDIIYVTNAIRYNYSVLHLINSNDIYDVCKLIDEYRYKDWRWIE